MAVFIPPQTRTVATNMFKNMLLNRVFDPNFNDQNAVLRSLKVFLLSYAHYETLCPQLYQQKYAEYIAVMQALFAQVPNIEAFIPQIQNQWLTLETIMITIGVIKFRTTGELIGPSVIIRDGVYPSNPLLVNLIRELQRRLSVSRQMPFNEFRQHRQQNTEISIQLGAVNVDPLQQLNTFRISYRQIHAEGFEDWFDCGRGAQMLVKIEFTVHNEPNITPDVVSSFHFHSIYLMLSRRLENLRAQAVHLTTGHSNVAHKRKVSYIRKRIDPNSEQAFWSTPNVAADVAEGIRALGVNALRDQSLRTIKYNDLQVGYRFFNEFEDSVCLCSEWCNWNAFFHFNPIYRFVLVAHNQLYMQNRTNIPEMYLFSTLMHSYNSRANIPAVQPTPRTPVFQLMSSANEYRIKYYEEFYLKIQSFANAFRLSRPNFAYFCGISYNFLRYDPNLPELCIQSDPNPFADICIENLIRIYKVMDALHDTCGRIPQLVTIQQRREWTKELEKISREKYKTFIKLCYDRQMTLQENNYDYLFSEDYEYSNLVTKTEGARDIKAIRDNVLKVSNPSNLRYVCNSFGMTYLGIHKFMAKVEPMLPTPHASTAMEDMFRCFNIMDTDFNAYNNNPNDPKTIHFIVPEADVNARGFGGTTQTFVVFYTLKLYYIGFEIQSNCVQSVVNYEKRHNYPTHQVFNEFDFIWYNDVIEDEYRNQFGNPLFGLHPQLIQNIEDFYDNFWGVAEHDINAQQWQDMNQYVGSAYTQYQRLYFWWRNNGNDRLNFRRIFNTFDENFERFITTSDDIFTGHIIPAIRLLSERRYEYDIEVMDHLVYYLVKANCYMTLASVSGFIYRFNELRVDLNVNRTISYSLSKPGWIHFFNTMRTVMKVIDRLRSLYIVFDSEFNRIANTFSQTKRMVKHIYRLYFKKFSVEWCEEMRLILNQPLLAHPITSQFLITHLAVGLSFISHFIDDFRSETHDYRRKCLHIFTIPPIPANNRQMIAYHTCRQAFNDFLRDPIARQSLTPLSVNYWTVLMAPILNAWNQLTAHQLHIDLAAADI